MNFLRSPMVAVTLALACVTATGACGSADGALPPLAIDSAIFDGLDRAVVEEVLESPVASKKINEEKDEAERDSLAQAIVANFITCRDVARVYREWMVTGTAPALAPGPVPDQPLAWYQWEPEHRQILQMAIDSGDAAGLRSHVVNDNGCGVWIPAKPGDTSGPTIQKMVQSWG